MTGVDFLKSCDTNVRVVEDLLDTPYTVYTSTDAELSLSDVRCALANLRQRNVLCALVKKELWVFGRLESEQNELQEAGKSSFNVQDNSTIGSDTGRRGSDGRSVKDIFLAAVEGLLAYSLCFTQSLVHLGSFAWLFVGDDHDEAGMVSGSTVLRLHVQFTETGTLYVSTTTHPSSLRPSSGLDAKSGPSLILAPSGLKAKSTADRNNGDINHPQERYHITFGSFWKQEVSEHLACEGIELDPDEEWICVELEDGAAKDEFLWPARLTLILTPRPRSHNLTQRSMDSWKNWFASADDSATTSKNPLADAEAWFVSASRREKSVNPSSELLEPANENSVLATTAMVAETPLATSPPFNQRLVDQQLAMAGIYPTPPDGLLPGHGTQQMTSDASAGTMQVDQGGLAGDLELVNSDENQPGRTSFGSASEAQAYQPSSDDLFGDMGEMEFGANEVGEADFDYFDEPDDLSQSADVDHDVEMTENADQVTHEDTETRHDASTQHEKESLVMEKEIGETSSRPTSSHSALQQASIFEAVQDQSMEPRSLTELEVPSERQPVTEPEKPLSPFGIRERLLPRPIPASALSQEIAQPDTHGRSSTFEPVSFNENLDIASKYADAKQIKQSTNGILQPSNVPNISLPPRRKRTREKTFIDPDSGVTDVDTSSEGDSYDSQTSVSEIEDMPPQLPWDTKKRKRASLQNQRSSTTDNMEITGPSQDAEDQIAGPTDLANMRRTLDSLLNNKACGERSFADGALQRTNTDADSFPLPPIDELLELSKLGLVYVAQIVSEQAASVIPSILESIDESTPPADSASPGTASAIRQLVGATFDDILPNVDECSIAKLALVKEPPQRPMSTPGKTPQTGHPRLPQREGSMQLGPDYFSILPPYIRVQRGAEAWEMLPPALSFWDALGLGPAGGPKDVSAITVVPSNMDLADMVQGFVKSLGSSYESHKLGSFMGSLDFDNALNELESYEDGHIFVGLNEEPMSLDDAMKAYAEVLADLGGALANVGHLNPDRTIAIVLVDPFESHRAEQYLCACFWQLCKAYRQNTPKAYQKAPRSDLVLQVLPVSLIASLDGLVLLDARQMGMLATEIYDRCPPSSKVAVKIDIASSLPILAAPAVEIASAPPKRIAFQLSSDPPSDLLHEGSVLHLAYAVSADRQWLTSCWVDSSGRYQTTSSLCLRGKSFQDVAGEMWEKTLEVLTARDVTWRIFIVTCVELEVSLQRCWRSWAASKPRRQMLHCTLLSVQTESSLHLMPPSDADTMNVDNATSLGGFLTTSSTTRATSFTVSPDASGQTNAPPTPAPTETLGEDDPDAHLVDTTDESWGVLLAPAYACSSSAGRTEPISTGLASGLLFRRGNLQSPDSEGRLESLGVTLHWDIRIRPSGVVDEGPPRQAEVTLREVLRMYRNLVLLTKVRSLDASAGGGGGALGNNRMLPVHVACAVKAAAALDGFLA